MSERKSNPAGSSTGNRVTLKYGNRPFSSGSVGLDSEVNRRIQENEYKANVGMRHAMGYEVGDEDLEYSGIKRPGESSSGSTVSTPQVQEKDTLAGSLKEEKLKTDTVKPTIEKPVAKQEPAAEPQIQAPTPPRKNSYLYNTYSSVHRANLGVRISGMANDNMQRGNILSVASYVKSMLDDKENSEDFMRIAEKMYNLDRARRGKDPIKKESSPVYGDFDDDISGPNMMQSRGGRIPMQNNSAESAHKREEALAASNRKFIDAMSDFVNMADRGPASSLSSGRYIQRHKNIHVDDRPWSQKPLGVKILDGSVYATLGLTALATGGSLAYALAPGAFAVGTTTVPAAVYKSGKAINLLEQMRRGHSVLRGADRLSRGMRILGAGTGSLAIQNALSDDPLTPSDVAMAYGTAALVPSIGTVKGLVTVASINAIPGAVSYVASPKTNLADSEMRVKDSDISDEDMDAYIKYGDAIRQYYSASTDKKYGNKIPSLEDFLYNKNYSGKGIYGSGHANESGWLDNLKSEIEHDMNRTSMKINKKRLTLNNIDAPDQDWIESNQFVSNITQGIGASLGDMQAMGIMQATNIAITRGMPKLYKAGGIKAGAGNFANATLMLAMNGVMSSYSRGIEASAQMYDSRIAKITDYVKNSRPDIDIPTGGTIMDVDDATLISMLGSDSASIMKEYSEKGSLSQDTREMIFDEILNSRRDWLDGDGRNALYSADRGSRDAMNQFMSLVIPESISAGLITGSFSSSSLRKKLSSDNSMVGSMAEWVDDAADVTYRRLWKATKNTKPAKWLANIEGKSWVTRAMGSTARVAGGMIKKAPIEAVQESFLEENPQFIISKNYEDGLLETSQGPIRALANTYVDALTAGKALLGISGDHRFDSNPELKENFKLSMILGGIMGGAMSSTGVILSEHDRRRDAMVKAYIKNNVIDNIRTNNTVERTRAYASTDMVGDNSASDQRTSVSTDVYLDKRARNNQDRVYNALDAAIEKLEEAKGNPAMLRELDIEESSIDDDIKALREEKDRARRVFSALKNKQLRDYAKSSGGLYGDNHAIAVALAVDYGDSAMEAMASKVERLKSMKSKVDESSEKKALLIFASEWNARVQNKQDLNSLEETDIESANWNKPSETQFGKGDVDSIINGYLNLKSMIYHHAANSGNKRDGDNSVLTGERIRILDNNIVSNIRELGGLISRITGKDIVAKDSSQYTQNDAQKLFDFVESDFGVGQFSDELVAESMHNLSSDLDASSNSAMSDIINNNKRYNSKGKYVRRFDTSTEDGKAKYYATVDKMVNDYRSARAAEDAYVKRTDEIVSEKAKDPVASEKAEAVRPEKKKKEKKQKQKKEKGPSLFSRMKESSSRKKEDSAKTEEVKSGSDTVESKPIRESEDGLIRNEDGFAQFETNSLIPKYDTSVTSESQAELIVDELISDIFEINKEIKNLDRSNPDLYREKHAELTESLKNHQETLSRVQMLSFTATNESESRTHSLTIDDPTTGVTIYIYGTKYAEVFSYQIDRVSSEIEYEIQKIEEALDGDEIVDVENTRNQLDELSRTVSKYREIVRSIRDSMHSLRNDGYVSDVDELISLDPDRDTFNPEESPLKDEKDDKANDPVSDKSDSDEKSDVKSGEDSDYEEAGTDEDEDKDSSTSDIFNALAESAKTEAEKVFSEDGDRRVLFTDQELSDILDSGDAARIQEYLDSHPELTNGVSRMDRSRIARTFFMTAANEDTKNFLYNIKSFRNVKARIDIKGLSREKDEPNPNKRVSKGRKTYRVGGTIRDGKSWYSFMVNDSDRRLNHGFNREDESTYDNALILMYVTYTDKDRNGNDVEKTIRFQLLHPGDAETQADLKNVPVGAGEDYVLSQSDRRFTDKEVSDLRKYRNAIIKAHNDAIEIEKSNPGVEAGVEFSGGIEYGEQRVEINQDDRGQVVYSKVDENSGLLPIGLSSRDVTISDIDLAYNRGDWGGGAVVSGDSVIGNLPVSGGQMVMRFNNSSSESGKSFAFLSKARNADIESSNPGSNSIVDAIYNMIVNYGGTGLIRFTINSDGTIFDKDGKLTQSSGSNQVSFSIPEILDRMIRFGEKNTRVFNSESDLATKKALQNQFYISSSGGTSVLHVGEEAIVLPRRPSDMSEESARKIKDFIRQSRVPISMDDLFNKDKNSDNKVRDIFKFAEPFFNQNPEVSEIKIADGFVIKKSDLDITWTGWVLDNKRLMSMQKNPPVTPSFLYGTDPVAKVGAKSGFGLVKNSQKSKEDAPTQEKTSKSAEESISALKKLEEGSRSSSIVSYTDENGNEVSFYEENGELWERVSSVKDEDLGKKSARKTFIQRISSANNLNNASPVGDMYDSFMRFFFDNISNGSINNSNFTYDKFIEFTKKIKGNYLQMAGILDEAEFRNLSSIAGNILTQINSMFPGGYSIFSNEILLKKRNAGGNKRRIELSIQNPDDPTSTSMISIETVGVAGTADMIVVDNSGKYHIFDFKTGVFSTTQPLSTMSDARASEMALDRNSQWVAQQSIYKDLLEDNTGGEVSSINIIFSPVVYVRETLDPSSPDALEMSKNFKPTPTKLKGPNGANFNVFGQAQIKNLTYKKSSGMSDRAILAQPESQGDGDLTTKGESSVKSASDSIMDMIRDAAAGKYDSGSNRTLGGAIRPGGKSLNEEEMRKKTGGQPRAVKFGESVDDPIDPVAIESLFKKKFGNSTMSVDFVMDAIGVSNGLNVVGLTHINGITMSNLASNSDAFHEAFHWISLMIMSRSDRMKMYQNFRKTRPEHKNYTDNQIEETLAEEFRLAYLSQLDSEGLIDGGKIKSLYPSSSLFGRISRALDFRAGLNKADANLLVRAFNNGYFDKKTGDTLSRKEFHYRSKTYEHGKLHGMTRLGASSRGSRAVAANLVEVKTEEDLDMVLSSMICEIFHAGNVKTPSDISDIDLGVIKRVAIATAGDILSKNNGDDVAANADPKFRMSVEIARRFDDFYRQEIIDKLSNLNVDTYEKTIREENGEEESLIGENLRHHTVESYKISKEETTGFEIKFFLSSIPMHSNDSQYEDGLVRDDRTGMLVPYQYDDIKNAIYNELHDEDTPAKMADKIKDLALNRKHDMFFSLYNMLSDMDLDFNTRFWINIYSEKNDFNSVIYNAEAEADTDSALDQKSLRVVDDIIDRNTKRLPISWGASLLYSNTIFKNTLDGFEFNDEAAQSMIDRYSAIVASLNKIRMDNVQASEEKASAIMNEFAQMVREMGIDIDENSIAYMLNSVDPNKTKTYAQKVKDIISSMSNAGGLFSVVLPSWIKLYSTSQFSKGGKLSIGDQIKEGKIKRAVQALDGKKLYGGKAQVKYFSDAYSNTHVSQLGNMAYGADGSPVYTISKRSSVADIFSKVSKDESYVDTLLKSEINKGSVILRAMKDSFSGKRDKVRLKMDPFLKMFQEYSSDRGRSYFDLMPAEDYIMKMTMLLDKRMTLPTMADKSKWGTLRFEDLFDFISESKSGQEKEAIQIGLSSVIDGKTGEEFKSVNHIYPDRMIRVLYNYMKSEFYAIQEAWSQYKSAERADGSIDFDMLVPEYHYDPKNKNNVFGGKGMRFRYMDSLVRTLDDVKNEDGSVSQGSRELIMLNDEIERRLSLAVESAERGSSSLFDEIDLMLKDLNDSLFKFPERPTDGRQFEDEAIDPGLRRMLSDAFTWRVEEEMEHARSLGILSSGGYLMADKSLYDRAVVKKLRSKISSAYSSTPGANIGVINELATFTIFANTAINHLMSEFELDKIISKDLAFYKSSDDKTKRLSSALSTGDKLRVEYPVGHPLHGKDTYNVMELSDFKTPSDSLESFKNVMYNSIVNRLIDMHNKSTMRKSNKLENIPDLDKVLSESNAEQITKLRERYSDIFKKADAEVSKAMIPYKDINVTDGMAYISVDMLKSIMSRSGINVYSDRMKRAFEIMESEDMSWMSKAPRRVIEDVYNLMYHPRKMIYFGDYSREFSDGSTLNIPKLNKMALFVLPRFMATGDLSTLYDKMSTPGSGKVDMAVFSSAVKVNSQNSQDIYERNDSGRQDDSKVLSNLNNAVISKQRFEYLRNQMPTDPHKGSTINMSTQPMKASMSNISSDMVFDVPGYGKMSGAQLRREWSMAMAEVSNRGKKNIQDKFGASFNNETGEFEFDMIKIAQFLLGEGKKSIKTSPDVIRQLADYVDNPAAFPNFSLEAFSDNERMEEQIVSLIMKETLQNRMPGGMMIQMSPFGIKKSTDRDASYLINGGRKLKFNREDMSIEAVVSINIFKDIIPADIESYDDQRKWLIDNGIIGENASPQAIGYRIPSQGRPSISSVSIVDVLPKQIGDTIILPYDFTGMNGSDFDIDKLFISRYHYAEGADGIIKPVEMDDKIPSKWANNSIEAVQNRLLATMIASMSNKYLADDNRNSIDSTISIIKEDVLPFVDSAFNRSDRKSPFLKSSLSYENQKKTDYMNGQAGIAPYALASVHHVIGQITGLGVAPTNIMKKYGIDSLDGIYDYKGETRILDVFSALINAHVDIANDPYIMRSGINPYTHKMASFLIRSGFGTNAFFFLSQKGMRDSYERANANSSEYLRSSYDDVRNSSFEDAVRGTISEYESILGNMKDGASALGKLVDEKNIVISGDYMKSDDLKNNLKPKNSAEWYAFQIMVMRTFLELSRPANSLSKAVKYSQVDTKKQGRTSSDHRLFRLGIMDLIHGKDHTHIANIENIFEYSFLGKQLENSSGLISSILRNRLIRTTPAVENAVDRIIYSLGLSRNDNREFAKTLNRDISSRVKSRFYENILMRDYNVSDDADGQIRRTILDRKIKSLFFGNNSIDRRFSYLKDKYADKLKNNAFFIHMAPNGNPANSEKRISTLIPRTGSSDNYVTIDQMKRHFSTLLNSDIQEISDFAKDYLAYRFYTSGDNFTPKTIKISEYDREDIGYYDYISEQLESAIENPDDFITDDMIDDIFMNKWYDSDYVPYVSTMKITSIIDQDGWRKVYDASPALDGEPNGKNKIRTGIFVSVDGKSGLSESTISYPIAFMDTQNKDYAIEDRQTGNKGYRQDWRPRPFVKTLVRSNAIEGQAGEKEYVQYKLAAIVIDHKAGARFPLYHAVGKKGSYVNGIRFNEFGLRNSNIVTNRLGVVITTEKTSSDLYKYSSGNSHNKLFLDYFKRSEKDASDVTISYVDAFSMENMPGSFPDEYDGSEVLGENLKMVVNTEMVEKVAFNGLNKLREAMMMNPSSAIDDIGGFIESAIAENGISQNVFSHPAIYRYGELVSEYASRFNGSKRYSSVGVSPYESSEYFQALSTYADRVMNLYGSDANIMSEVEIDMDSTASDILSEVLNKINNNKDYDPQSNC